MIHRLSLFECNLFKKKFRGCYVLYLLMWLSCCWMSVVKCVFNKSVVFQYIEIMCCSCVCVIHTLTLQNIFTQLVVSKSVQFMARLPGSAYQSQSQSQNLNF